MPQYPKRLGTDKSYDRPKYTYQEQLDADDIAKLLEGYQKVEDISNIPINTHIRYFTNSKNGDHTFRTGGFLHNKENCDKYIILSNGKYSWSVQTKKSIFFKKMTHSEEIESIHRLYHKKLKKKDKIIRNLSSKLNK